MPRFPGCGLRSSVLAETLLYLGVALLLSGCFSNRIQLPPSETLHEPRRVFLLDHGRHTSLVLETPGGSLVRYAYGDWRYYADEDTRLRSGLAALLWPTPATLARRELPGPAYELAVLRQVRVGSREIHTLTFSGIAVDGLRAQLDEIHAREPDRHQYVSAYDLVFAPHPDAYTFLNNSNTMVADWLRRLGADVRGTGWFSLWRVHTPHNVYYVK